MSSDQTPLPDLSSAALTTARAIMATRPPMTAWQMTAAIAAAIDRAVETASSAQTPTPSAVDRARKACPKSRQKLVRCIVCGEPVKFWTGHFRTAEYKPVTKPNPGFCGNDCLFRARDAAAARAQTLGRRYMLGDMGAPPEGGGEGR